MHSPTTTSIDIWYTHTTGIGHDTAERRCYPLLCEAEHAQSERFQVPVDRKNYLITRTLVREVLSKYLPLAPSAWRFETNAYGRPRIAADCATDALRFNISHSRDLVICAVASTEEIGVDTEPLDRRDLTLDMAKRYFAGLEVDAIEALPEPQRQRRLLEHWTLKEAYLKARGYGLHLPTDGAAFTFGSDRQISSAFDHRMGDTPAGWRFGHLAPIHNHLIAYAVRPAANHPLRVRILDALLFN